MRATTPRALHGFFTAPAHRGVSLLTWLGQSDSLGSFAARFLSALDAKVQIPVVVHLRIPSFKSF